MASDEAGQCPPSEGSDTSHHPWKQAHAPHTEGEKSVNTKLKRIRSMSKSNKNLQFTSVYHLVSGVDQLRASYHALDGRKAVGVDGQTKEEYGENLEENLQDLSNRLNRFGYRPKPARRTWIEKPGKAEKRPLAISCFEDKIVQHALRDVLEAIFEPSFLRVSYGYRNGKSVVQCVDDIGRCIQKRKINWILEADIRKFFDRMNHDWLLKFIGHRVADPRIVRLLTRLLRSGIMEDGLVSPNEEGAPQGSILSPLLSNIYLHYVLDLWFDREIKHGLKGEGWLFRYADDFIICLQNKQEAEEVMSELKERLGKFSLQLADEKTRRVRFGRFEAENARRQNRKPGSFEFLGFRFVCGCTHKGYFKVKRRTSGKRLRKSLNELKCWLDEQYAKMRKGELIRAVVEKVRGHLGHFAITDNLRQCSTYLFRAAKLLFKALSRKSQRRPYTWKGFKDALKHNAWPKAKLIHNINPCRQTWKQLTLKGGM